MYSKKQLFFIVIFSIMISNAMEQQPFHKPKKTIAIRGTDNEILGVSEDVALQATMIRNYFAAHDEAVNAGEKECSSGEGTFDFTRYVFNRVFSDNEETEALDLNTDVLKLFFACVADEKNIHRLDKDEVLHVFEVAHCLGSSESIMKKLTERASSLISKKEFRENAENPLYVMIRDGHYIMSVKQLFQANRLKTAIEHAKTKGSLCLQSRNIDTLDGIEEVARICPLITCLNLSKNNLKTLNIRLLYACWPTLQKIKANKTGISEVIWPSSLPHAVTIKLNNNCLNEDTFFIPEQATVSLKNNKIKINPDVIIKKPTIFERHRPIFKTIVDPQVVLRTGAGFILYSGLFLGIPLSLYKFFNPEVSLLPTLYGRCKDPLFLGVLFSWPLATTTAFYTQHVFPQALTHNMQYQYKPGKVVIENEDEEI